MNNKELKAETEAQQSGDAALLPSAPLVANPMLCEDLPPNRVDVLCYFKGSDNYIICRVGHWNILLNRWRIHSDGLDRYYKEIIEWQEIPLMITVL